ncbi:dynamin-related protein 3A [Artemisia annua]|uniref:Dynamin-related protein 3A n=1 Tax=Artemisia annua TaxID=35608 RepID=A0A2U1MRQ1_ARTAN|nr:dynamin-related protein 3A [Artemisia annua]
MEMDYINTSQPNFIGGSKAVEIAIQVKSSKTIDELNQRFLGNQLETLEVLASSEFASIVEIERHKVDKV